MDKAAKLFIPSMGGCVAGIYVFSLYPSENIPLLVYVVIGAGAGISAELIAEKLWGKK